MILGGMYSLCWYSGLVPKANPHTVFVDGDLRTENGHRGAISFVYASQKLIAKPAEIANPILYPAIVEAGFITGSTLQIDDESITGYRSCDCFNS